MSWACASSFHRRAALRHFRVIPINEGMRARIPDARTRARTVTLYIDLAQFMRALGIPGKDEVHVLLVDRQGSILWRTTGGFDEAKGRALVDALAAYQGRDASPGRPAATS